MYFYSKILTLTVFLLSWMPVHSLAQSHENNLPWKSFEEAIHFADTTEKLILIDVWAPWCGWCHKMRTETYPQLSEILSENFVLGRLNRDDNQATHRYNGQIYTSFEIAQKLKVEQVPAIVILKTDGEYLLHISGYWNTEKLRPILKYLSSGAYQNREFSKFLQQQ